VTKEVCSLCTESESYRLYPIEEKVWIVDEDKWYCAKCPGEILNDGNLVPKNCARYLEFLVLND